MLRVLESRGGLKTHCQKVITIPRILCGVISPIYEGPAAISEAKASADITL